MRIAALLGCAVLTVACTTKESAPPADTAAAAAVPAGPEPVALGHLAGIWNVTAKPEGKDSVATTYVMNNTDTTDWTFAFPKGKPVHQRVTAVHGDTVFLETDLFESDVRKGLKVRTNSEVWEMDGKLMGKTTAHYQTTGPDTVRVFITEGVRK
ncbi:MAG TPA: hypothetical protein VFD22_09940 [Gemmatimonadaceae bacterium]|nr:hypothetical protein [Gemmatimonadaceae bacterium]